MATQKNNNKSKTTVNTKTSSTKHHFDFVFNKDNYMYTIIAFAVIVLGFILMYGGTEDIYSTRRITIAPIVVIIGFCIGVYAIMKKPKSDNDVA